MNVNIDFIGKAGQIHQGDVANMLMTNQRLDVGTMRPFIGEDGKSYITVFKGGDAKKPENYASVPTSYGTLRRDEWKQLDEAIIPVAESRLNGINDLVSRGLVYNLGNAMGTTVLEFHKSTDSLEAVLTMDGISRGKNDRPEFSTNYLPIPIIHVDYEINARVLAASRSLGNPLDTFQVERAARKVAEKLEAMLFTNTTYAFGGGTIQSYINFTDRSTKSITAWTTSGKTGAQIIDDVMDMKQASIDDYHYGPWVLYIPTSYETKMDEDYSSSKGENTIRDRILKIGGIMDVKVVDTLPTNNVVLVQMTTDTVRLVRGMGIQNVQWKSEGDFVNNFKVMTIQVPQIRSDENNRSGIVHASV
jgi:uncharacterized linocin/CFP29 family protein